MMALLLIAFMKKHGPALVFVGLLLLIGGSIYLKGWSDRGVREISASQTRTIDRTDNRGKTNEKVRKFDSRALCNALDGVYSNNECK
ncbi:hypothetical protein [Pseudochrobactrum asaccharolyticum]|uniref:Uncharacterized protein n=1 Tax=Pseudochrobactrum asaccharolyticum TaxID=354351 RepID=A0A366DY04_9HYPH|nr:hypothetical protein [Pseudochrobactrum asaccharolyticum]RBO94937.1 hypothetical protein DFR47_104299 [Pseudochrobactrum asaccharolyticum]